MPTPNESRLWAEAKIEAITRQVASLSALNENYLAKNNELSNELHCQDAKVAEQKAEIEESDALREKLATLLAETAVALKGKEAALHRHSFHDLPVVALEKMIVIEQQKEQLTATQAHNELLRDALTEEVKLRELGQSVECGQLHWESIRDMRRSVYAASSAALAIESPDAALKEHDAALVERIAHFIANAWLPMEGMLGHIADNIRKGKF